MKIHSFLIVFATAVLTVSSQAQELNAAESVERSNSSPNAPRAALPPELKKAHQKAKADMKSKGYMEQTDQLPRSELIMEKLQQLSKETSLKKQQGLKADQPIFQKLEDVELKSIALRPKSVPDHFIHHDSKNIIMSGDALVRRIYSKTDYGMLLIEESKGELFLDEPNLSIAGHDAKFAVSKHKGGKWATTIFATDGKNIFRIESNRRLNSRALDSFVLFADDLISYD